ncbi:MAG: hypothetical protein HYW25_03210 [Candidatus Aenigmarchaeota archaeon]|nr:hypothetical protein [Candidatus Aenigmarchaeota archaeon]
MFQTLKEKNNPHMKRKELMLLWEHIAGATPSRSGIQSLLSKEWSVEPEKVDIKSIFSLKGRPQSRVKVYVWEQPRIQNLSQAKESPAEEKKE